MKNYFLLILITITLQSFGQCDKSRIACNTELAPYISDGQYRVTNLMFNESKKFGVTFYGGKAYKIVVGNDEGLGNIQFKLYNSSHTVLFDSKFKEYPSSWVLKFKKTTTAYIEVNHISEEKEGCALLLVGFEN